MSEKIFQKKGSASLQALIREAEKGSREATIQGNWEIETAIRLPSDFTLILDGCHLKMADGVFSNMFNNEHFGTDLGKTAQGTDKNIKIIGKNGAILDGGNYNGLSEKTQRTPGFPEIWRNNLILFTNVDGFEMRGFACHNQRWWAMNFIYCCNGILEDLDFQACDLAIDENGNFYRGLIRKRYKEVYVKNADGIDLRQGCHHITIENITGFTEDDTIALTNLNGRIENNFAVAGLCPDICHIKIKNIRSAAFCTNVRLLNQGGLKLHHIEIDGVYDQSANSPHIDVGHFGVRIGDLHLYGSRHNTAEETYAITIKNVRSRAEAALSLVGGIGELHYENIEAFDGAKVLDDQRV